MEPGKARRLPVPRIFRIKAVPNAADVLNLVPQRTARKILIICCKGKALVAPRGKEKSGESSTPAATKSAEKIHFRRESCLSITPP